MRVGERKERGRGEGKRGGGGPMGGERCDMLTRELKCRHSRHGNHCEIRESTARCPFQEQRGENERRESEDEKRGRERPLRLRGEGKETPVSGIREEMRLDPNIMPFFALPLLIKPNSQHYTHPTRPSSSNLLPFYHTFLFISLSICLSLLP